MLNAEELGVTKANVDEMLKSPNPEIKRLLGVEGKFGEAIGLTADWAVPHRQAGRQLRRILREERRPGLAAEDCARPERTLDQGRPAIRPAGSLTSNQIRAPTSFGARAAHAHAE
jgi:hypothetical protein